MSGLMQVYKTHNTTDQALLKLREWSVNFGFPMTLVTDSGPAFRNNFEEEFDKMGVRVEHSSAYNPSTQSVGGQSEALVEEVSKHIPIAVVRNGFALNTKFQPNDTGSPTSRFYGRDVRGSLPNSLNRNWSHLMDDRRKIFRKRVEKRVLQ